VYDKKKTTNYELPFFFSSFLSLFVPNGGKKNKPLYCTTTITIIATSVQSFARLLISFFFSLFFFYKKNIAEYKHFSDNNTTMRKKKEIGTIVVVDVGVSIFLLFSFPSRRQEQ
jgi:hypothetical protein